ncbi:ribonuclease P protein component [Candidatus Saccharibacteria bacterium]|nr:ribonuclease P protein component [Candidatus Saccharibacteria bacterium]
MLARNNRFHGSRAIQRLYKAGKAARTKFLGLKYSTTTGDFRAAVVVSRKVHKSAVVRNRIRRRLYEILRAKHGSNLRGVEILITVFDAQVALVTTDELQKEVATLLSKARLLSGENQKRAIVDVNRLRTPGASNGRK